MNVTVGVPGLNEVCIDSGRTLRPGERAEVERGPLVERHIESGALIAIEPRDGDAPVVNETPTSAWAAEPVADQGDDEE